MSSKGSGTVNAMLETVTRWSAGVLVALAWAGPAALPPVTSAQVDVGFVAVLILLWERQRRFSLDVTEIKNSVNKIREELRCSARQD